MPSMQVFENVEQIIHVELELTQAEELLGQQEGRVFVRVVGDRPQRTPLDYLWLWHSRVLF